MAEICMLLAMLGLTAYAVLAGADLLLGGLKAVLRTVDINLPALKEPATRRAFAERAVQLEQTAQETYARICTEPGA